MVLKWTLTWVNMGTYIKVFADVWHPVAISEVTLKLDELRYVFVLESFIFWPFDLQLIIIQTMYVQKWPYMFSNGPLCVSKAESALPGLSAVVVVTLLRENPGGDMRTQTHSLWLQLSLTHTYTHTHRSTHSSALADSGLKASILLGNTLMVWSVSGVKMAGA